MIAERLRKSVLQAAIQGKLTQQLPEDGDARDLLKQIQLEKEKLIAEGKLRKEKELPAITEDEKPFDIPENWVCVRLGEIFNLQAGKFISASNIHNKGAFPCFGGNGLRGYVSNYNWSGRYALIGRQGALCGNINIADGDFYATEHAVVVERFADCSPDWSAYTLLALNLNQYATATAQPGLAVSKINHILLPLPPLAEQVRFVHVLNQLFDKIEKLKSDELIIKELQKKFPSQMKNAILQHAMEGKLTQQLPEDGNAADLLNDIRKEKARLVKEGKLKKQKPLPAITEDEIPFDIPENWIWVRLSDIAEINPRNQVADDKLVSFMPMKLLDAGYDSVFTHESKLWKDIKYGFTHFADNDVVFAKITPCFENRKSAIMQNLTNKCGAGTTELHVLRLISSKILREYLLYFIKSEYFISTGSALMTGTAGQKRVGTNTVKSFLMPLPPTAEQHRIVQRLSELLPLCESLE